MKERISKFYNDNKNEIKYGIVICLAYFIGHKKGMYDAGKLNYMNGYVKGHRDANENWADVTKNIIITMTEQER